MMARDVAAPAVAEFDPETTEAPPNNILRWEDDGGKIIEIDRSTLDQKRKKPNE